MAGEDSGSPVTPGSDSRGNSNLNRTKKYQSQKIKNKNVKRRKQTTQKGLIARCKAKSQSSEITRSRARASGPPGSKGKTIKQMEGGRRDSVETPVSTRTSPFAGE